MKKILVVGGTGLIGAHLVNDLIKNGNKVFSLSNNKRKIDSKASFFYLDISKKINTKILRKFDPEIIVYAASLNSKDSEIFFNKGYIIGHIFLVQLLNFYKSKKKLKKVIFLSTAQVYKDYTYKKIDLKSEVYPSTAYSLFHIQSEKFLRYFSEKFKIKAICLRISNGYGEPIFGKTKCWSIVINNFCLQAYKNNLIKINSDPNQYRNFIYVRDISKEIIQQIKKKYKKNFVTVNIGSNQNYRIKDLAVIIKKIFLKLLNKKVNIIISKKKRKKLKMHIYTTNNLIDKNKLTTINQGISNIVNYLHSKNAEV
jgi:UDP-glucose 4-epimerase